MLSQEQQQATKTATTPTCESLKSRVHSKYGVCGFPESHLSQTHWLQWSVFWDVRNQNSNQQVIKFPLKAYLSPFPHAKPHFCFGVLLENLKKLLNHKPNVCKKNLFRGNQAVCAMCSLKKAMKRYEDAALSCDWIELQKPQNVDSISALQHIVTKLYIYIYTVGCTRITRTLTLFWN